MKRLLAWKKDKRGVTTIEIVLILVVLIALVIIFKGQITSVLQTILTKVQTQSGRV